MGEGSLRECGQIRACLDVRNLRAGGCLAGAEFAAGPLLASFACWVSLGGLLAPGDTGKPAGDEATCS